LSRRFLFPVCFFLILLSLEGTASAGENEDFRFAEKLRRDGMFVAAAEEYVRFSDRYPASELRPRAIFLAGESWMQAGRADKALESFQNYIMEYPDGAEVCRARFYRGRILKKLERYNEAASELLMINDEYPDCALAGRALYEAGEALLFAGNPEEASLILRKLIKSSENSDLLPVATYTLALSLINMDRELEAYSELEKLVEKYPDSPLAGMALIKLGDNAVSEGMADQAEGYYNRLLESRREDHLREKGMFRLIDLYSRTDNPEKVLESSREYFSMFEDGKNRDRVYGMAVHASHELGRVGRTLELIDSFRKEFPEADSTGWTYRIKARVYRHGDDAEKALAELERMQEKFPGAGYSPEILILKAELNGDMERYSAAVRFYRMALSGDLAPAERGEALAAMAEIYSARLGEPAEAVLLWKEAARTGTPELRRKAMFRAAEAEEAAGDCQDAAALYRKLIEEFPDSESGEEAQRRVELIKLRPRVDSEDFAGSMQRLLKNPDINGAVLVEAAVTFLEYSLVEAALELLREAGLRELSGEDAAKREYYLGKAYWDRYRRSALKGEDGGDDMDKAISHWRTGVNEYGSTGWGEKSYRSYLNARFESWEISRRLSGLDKFMGYYKRTESRIWALRKKADILYSEAGGESSWAVDSALAVCAELESLSLSECDMAEIIRKKGYLYSWAGDEAAAAGMLSEYINDFSACGCDPRAGYDLGEIRIKLKDYQGAMEAYRHCLSCAEGRMKLNCRLRNGDCYFYLREYGRAEREYRAVSEQSPGTSVADVSLFRRALALEKMREAQRADSIYSVLLERDKLGRNLRIRTMEKLGKRYYAENNFNKAGEYYRELVSLTGSPENRMIYAEILFGKGEFEKAERYFTGTLEFEEADSSRVLAGRALARYRMGKIEKADRDLSTLRKDYPRSGRLPEVLLVRGKVLIESEDYESARKVFEELGAGYQDYADETLYYLAVCDIQSGGYREAEEKLVRHLREAPHSSLACAAYFKLAFVQTRMEKLNLAARNYSLAAESCSGSDLSFRALKNLAEVYQKMEDWEEASSVWFRIVKDYPARDDIVDLLFNLGFSYGQSGRYRLARDVYSRITTITAEEDELGRAYYWIGINLKNIGKCGDAVRQFLRVPYLRTGGMWGVTAKLEAAGCYRKMGRYEEAGKIYQSVLNSHGKDSDWGKIASKYLEQISEKQKKTGGQG